MELGYILRRAWRITWEHKLLWVFGFLVGLGMMGLRLGASGSQWDLAVQELPPEMRRPIVAFLDGPHVTMALVALTLLGLVAGVGLSLAGNLGRVGLVHQTRAAEEYGIIVLKGGWLAAKHHLWQVFLIRLLLGLPVGVLVLAGALPGIVARLLFAGQEQFEVAILGEITVQLLRLVCSIPAGCLSLLLSIPIGVLQRLSVRACVLEKPGVRVSIVRAWEILHECLGELVLVWLVLLSIGITVVIVFVLPLALLGVSLWVVARLMVLFSPLLSLALTLAVGLLMWLVVAAGIGMIETFSSVVWTLAYRELTGMGRTGEGTIIL